MRKIKIIICVIMLFAAAFGTVTAQAAAALVLHGEPSTSTVYRGDTFSYTMELRGEENCTLSGISYYLRYDPDVFEVTEIKTDLDERIAGMKLGAVYDREDFKVAGDILILSDGGIFAPQTPVPYPVSLARVTFRVKANAAYGTYHFGSKNVAFTVITPDSVSSADYTAELGSVTVAEKSTPPTPPSGGGGGGVTSYTVTFEYRDGDTLVKSDRNSYTRNTALTSADLKIPEGYELAADFSHTVTKTETVTVAIKKTGETAATPDPYREKPYISGYPDGAFKPDAQITRAETAQILYNMLANSAAADLSQLDKFSDMSERHWADTPLAWAVANGYLSGYPEGTLMPNANITRAELSAVLHRVAVKEALLGEIGAAQVKLTDIDGHWAHDDIWALAEKGIIQGYPDNTFAPDNSVTRAETVAMFARLFKRTEEFGTGKTFTDVPATHWAYEYIMNAANGVVRGQ